MKLKSCMKIIVIKKNYVRITDNDKVDYSVLAYHYSSDVEELLERIEDMGSNIIELNYNYYPLSIHNGMYSNFLENIDQVDSIDKEDMIYIEKHFYTELDNRIGAIIGPLNTLDEKYDESIPYYVKEHSSDIYELLTEQSPMIPSHLKKEICDILINHVDAELAIHHNDVPLTEPHIFIILMKNF